MNKYKVTFNIQDNTVLEQDILNLEVGFNNIFFSSYSGYLNNDFTYLIKYFESLLNIAYEMGSKDSITNE